MQPSSRAPPKPKGPPWPGPPYVTVFLRNLRLLQLDGHQDWPDITEDSFSTSQQNSRRRIHAVEWALYYLFQLWDPTETQNKLRPFFPPVEPLQSVNLRAALFRALSDLKKNGFLPREVVLRKTMLDDCKGEKFEEAIAAFSTAVLRRCISSQGHGSYDPVLRMATSGRLTTTEQETLLPLVLAYRGSLTRLLEERKRVDESNDANDSFIRSTLSHLSERSEHAPITNDKDLDSFAKARRDVKSAWSGSESWADMILDGGTHDAVDPLLGMEFPDAWSVIKAGGSLAEVPQPSHSTDLLLDLENRLEQQQTRLKTWKEFRKTIAAGRRVSTKETRRENTSPLLFREHQELSAAVNQQLERGLNDIPRKDDYSSLLSDIKGAMDNLEVARDSHKEHQHPTSPKGQIKLGTDLGLSLRKDDGDAAGSPEPVSHDSTITERTPPLMKRSSSGSTHDKDLIEVPTPSHASERSNTPSILVEADPTPASDVANEDSLLSPVPQHPTPEFRRATTLMERTRESLSLRPGSSSSRTRHTPVEHQPRQSYPINQFETPHQRDHGRSSGAHTPQEELFSQDADYASVFKSRPKVAMSPVNSPAVQMPPVADDEGAHEEERSRDFFVGESSPLARKQKR